MNGFGTIQSRDINEIVAGIEKQIKTLKSDFGKDVVVLQNRLESCVYELNILKEKLQYVQDYNETEYGKIQAKIAQFDEDIAYIKDHLNTITYNETVGGKCASGINYFPIYSRYTEKDISGRDIIPTYATKAELSSASGSSMSALSSVSSTLNTAISTETERATSAEQHLTNSISKEISDRTNAIIDLGNELGQQIANEEQARESADTTLQTNIENEVNRATSRENELEGLINSEQGRAESKEQELSGNIETLSSYVDTQVENINDNIESVSSSLHDNIEQEKQERISSYSSLNDKLDNEITRAISAETDIYDYINDFANVTEQNFEDIETTISSLSSEIDNNYYTKAEVDKAISDFGGFEVHATLEEITSPKSNIIYLIGPDGLEPDLYKEYIYNSTDDRFILIGDTTVDLRDYYKIEDIDGFVSALNTAIENESSRATTKENALSSKIEELSGTVDTNISVLSSTIDREFEKTYDYIDDLSSTFDTNISALSSVIDENFDTVYDYIDDLSACVDSGFSAVNNEIQNLYNTKQDNITFSYSAEVLTIKL